ncbi:hypothetical protein NPS01_01130 [Nocardioides psychrotolerans]|uniref:Uncharacterized protein n=1 Tax=Nocardioides psychrotolerans TaxID=1005945 RepID=A0A1I3BU91_9ACTN|nr:hypothetical protein [Nocardioides psychrotolerans]GEP36450.1 hypothetical protein NPS01_01130 [Nocardioides psychrotolerans]SFH65822.1 hypothetical protein SAMN05216561_101328 [Nocardioides psychrotolerans]
MTDDELQQRLQAHDPAASLPPADPTWVARLLEDAMSADQSTESPGTRGDSLAETRESGTRHRSPLTWLVAAAAAVLIGGVGVFGLLNNDRESGQVPSAGPGPGASVSGAPTVTELAAGAPTQGRCMVPSAEVLSNAQVAFSGTVEAVGADVVSLTPDRFYAGEVTDVVEVRTEPAMMQALVGVVDFQPGQRYLVAATGGEVMVCGFSGAFAPRLESLYVAAFPG